MSVLERIIAYKREEVASRKRSTSAGDLEARIAQEAPPRAFFKALTSTKKERPSLIAEIKKASPSKGVIRADFQPAALAQAYAEGGAACLSVLTDTPSFQGREEYLSEARTACALPVLRKDFIIDPWQVIESRAIGADAILIIMSAVDYGLAAELARTASDLAMDVLVEVHDEVELERGLKLETPLIGVNNRSLETFETNLATTERLAPLIPPDRLLVSESGISTAADVARLQRAGVGAMLVGESLMRQKDVAAATRALLASEPNWS